MMKGIVVKNIVKLVDERGFFTEIIRTDWQDTVQDEIVQVNFSYSYPGVIRAWHRHLQGQNDYFTIIEGSIKLCAYDDREDSESYGELDEIILSSEKPSLVRIPGYLWHGFKVLGVQPIRLIYGVNRLYNYSKPDEERRSWNDPTIIPLSINGRKNDPRANQPWDWNYPSHK